ncbi:protein translocase subunit SecD [Patescibacteria group bacterium]|nr:protein translocase subunit SecD [Patescibacteria group bacterium]MBU0964548.1 protein translocase subunit SecD [Patescibacteria group bacterium]
MVLRKKVWLTFAGILLLTALAGVVDYPKGPDIKIGEYFKELKVHLGLDLQGGSHLLYDADTTEIPNEDKTSALEGVRDVIERRVNAFGVSEPLIQTSKKGNNWRIIVELAGITDVNEAISMIGETPLLEFKEEVTEEMTEEEKNALVAINEEAKKKAEEVLAQVLQPEADFAALANEYSEDPGNTDYETEEKKGGDLDFFTREMMVPEFTDVIFDKLEVNQIFPELVETQFGYHIIKKTGVQDDQARASHILFMKQSTENQPTLENTGLSGKQLERSYVEFDPNTNEPQVALEFDNEGKELFAAITERNVNKIVGIYLDGSPISLPRVNQAIRDGTAIITGSFNLDEAKLLAQRLNAGALPVPITLVSQHNVGATLGSVSVEKSLLAGIVGLILVAIFMVIYYRLPGFMSVFALLTYAMLVLAIFKLIPVTLTLAGIAGFILSIGMAVDANILIFERSKEELQQGKSLKISIEEGFKRAWPSIRDSNISSLITCAILAWFGTSIIKGFAITLGIGVILSMFSAITVSRTFLRLTATQWLEKRTSWFSGHLK